VKRRAFFLSLLSLPAAIRASGTSPAFNGPVHTTSRVYGRMAKPVSGDWHCDAIIQWDRLRPAKFSAMPYFTHTVIT
jgi:hypothetical protein